MIWIPPRPGCAGVRRTVCPSGQYRWALDPAEARPLGNGGGASQRSGIAFGLDAAIGSPIGIGIEAMYAQRGVVGAVSANTRNLSYVDVPVYLRLSLPTPLPVSPFAYAGHERMLRDA